MNGTRYTHHPTPEFGQDVSILEALGSKRNIPSFLLDLHGIQMHTDARGIDAHLEGTAESSMKLASFILHNYDLLPLVTPKSGYVVDLGCRNGFAGIAALQVGYQAVIFAEVNDEVLRNATWPNIVLNCPHSITNCRCVLAGNWVALSEYLSIPGENKWTPLYFKFELVLVTLPNVENLLLWEKLHSLLLRHLTATGIALVNVAASITPGVSVPLSAHLNHTLFQSASCVGSKLYDIVRIVRKQ